MCRYPGCIKSYKRKKNRTNHESSKHKASYDISTESEETVNTDKEPHEDYKFAYARGILSFNLFLRDFNDAIREGDGSRLIELYKVALLYFKCYHHTKYAFTVLKLLIRIQCQPERAFDLTWQRFVNTSGKKGRNISLDLHLEHLNNFLKEQLKNLRSNLNEKQATRISRAMGPMHELVKNASKLNDDNYHKTPKHIEDVLKLCKELVAVKIFHNRPGREHPSFPRFSENLLNKLDMDKMSVWLNEKKIEFEELYRRL